MTDRPPSTGDDAVELASRHLDGDLGLDERAAAEADADVMDWLERFGRVRAALREPVEIDAGAREAALTAALAAFDDVAAETPTAPPGVGDLAAARARRTGRVAKWLGAAAAVVAVAVGGAVLAGNSGGDDTADEALVFSAESQLADAPTEAPSDKSSASDSASSPMAAAAPGSFEATTGAADSAATTAAGGERTADQQAEAEATPATTLAAAETTAGGATVATTAGTEYSEPADLQALADAPIVTPPAGTEAPCSSVADGDLVAADVTYAGRPAAIYRDAAQHTLAAWALDSCEPLATTPYPAD